MTWPVSKNAYGSYGWLVSQIGSYLNFGADSAVFNHEQVNVVDSCISSGLKRFYFPPPVNEERHQWSFLVPTRTLTTSANDGAYDLPEDFTGSLDGFTFASNVKIPIIKEMELRAMQAKEAATAAAPKFAAIRPKPVDGAAKQNWEVIFYPTPDTTYTLSYSYQINPGDISEDLQSPQGGPEHAETILEACLAVAETRFMGMNDGPHQAAFLERLGSSVLQDQKLKAISGGPWSITEPVAGTYKYLLREAGLFLGYGANPDTYTYDEDRRANSLVQRGIRAFYSPPRLDGEQHNWSFLMTKATLSLVADDSEYDLPSDFGTVADEITFSVNGKQRRVEIISEGTLRAQQAKADMKGAPVYAAIRQKSPVAYTAEQVFELVCYPTPDTTYTLHYRYNVSPADASTTNLYPLGTKVHSETLLASVLAVCELQRDGKRGDHHQLFMERLGASIQIDRMASGRRTERVDNQGRTDNTDRS